MRTTKKDLIYEILTNHSKGLHVRDIAKELLRQNLEDNISEDDLMNKVSSILSSDIKKYKAKSRFRRIPNNKGGYKQGWYRLKKVRKPLVDASIERIGKGKIEIPTISSLYTGKAGEHAVLSELLFNEFNVSLMSVDEGIDVVASKNEKFFHIQVKTANSRGGTFFTSIARKQFERFNKADTFYVLVLRYSLNEKIRSDFLILGSFDIERFIETGVIKRNDNLNLSVSVSGTKIILNNKEDISFYFNRFSAIK